MSSTFTESIVEDAAIAWLGPLRDVLLAEIISGELRAKDAKGIAEATA